MQLKNEIVGNKGKMNKNMKWGGFKVPAVKVYNQLMMSILRHSMPSQKETKKCSRESFTDE